MSPAPPPPAATLFRFRTAALSALLVVLTAVPAVVAPAPPAAAHPFGPPQTVVVVDGGDGTVRVRWRVGGTDDLALLGVSLGVIDQDRVTLDGAVAYEDTDATVLWGAREFRDYLLAHVVVTAGEQQCPGDAAVTEEFAADGVELTYDCPGDPAVATVEVTTLTDLHPAYQTLATGPSGQRAVYNADQPSHDWSLGGAGGDAVEADLGNKAAVQLSTVLGVLLLALVAALAWRRRGDGGRGGTR